MRQTETQKNWNKFYNNKNNFDFKEILKSIVLIFALILIVKSILNNININKIPDDIAGTSKITNVRINPGSTSILRNSAIDGEDMKYALDKLKEYKDVLDIYSKYDEIIEAAKNAEKVEVHQFYEKYKNEIANSLNEFAEMVKAEKSYNELAEYQNNKIIELFDILESCFDIAGVKYNRKAPNEIEYYYYKYR